MTFEQATILVNLSTANKAYKPAYIKCLITKTAKLEPTVEELETVRNEAAFKDYFVTVDSTFVTRLTDPTLVGRNRALLTSLGCSKAQVDELATREFSALPKWIRTALKKFAKPAQVEPLKLRPAAGQLAFYISPDRFPLQRDSNGNMIMPYARKDVKHGQHSSAN